jgi:phosphopantetheinyl transferase (holo-ACP synthase)
MAFTVDAVMKRVWILFGVAATTRSKEWTIENEMPTTTATATIIRLQLIRFSHDDDDVETIDEAFLGDFLKRVEVIQILPKDGGDTTRQEEEQCCPEKKNLSSQILRYVKNRDRWLALASCLLKSQVYHHIVQQSPSRHTKSDARAIVDLPRSALNKPYIPLLPPAVHLLDDTAQTTFQQQQQPERCCYNAFSVSHQWPFVGVAFLLDNFDEFNSSDDHFCDGADDGLTPRPTRPTRPPPHVGFDLVVFDKPNDKLYRSTMEFVEVFENQFAPNEWQNILDCGKKFGNDTLLCEFYLRWSVKEAYSKALGLGMNINFAEFESVFQLGNNELAEEGLDDGLWRWIRSQPAKGPFSLQGTVVSECGSTIWQFSFLPLFAVDDIQAVGPHNKTCVGCGCVCVGPLSSEQLYSVSNIDIETEWSSTTTLMKWHYQGHHDQQQPQQQQPCLK